MHLRKLAALAAVATMSVLGLQAVTMAPAQASHWNYMKVAVNKPATVSTGQRVVLNARAWGGSKCTVNNSPYMWQYTNHLGQVQWTWVSSSAGTRTLTVTCYHYPRHARGWASTTSSVVPGDHLVRTFSSNATAWTSPTFRIPTRDYKIQFWADCKSGAEPSVRWKTTSGSWYEYWSVSGGYTALYGHKGGMTGYLGVSANSCWSWKLNVISRY